MKLDYFIGEKMQKEVYSSQLVQELSASGRGARAMSGRMTVFLAPKLGFCHGVTRAIRMAMHTLEKYRDRNVYLLSEIVHNPFLNRELKQRGIRFLGTEYQLSDVRAEDVVIVPAFGASTQTYAQLTASGCTVIDTTCGEVMSVWKRVEKYHQQGFTALVFGKYSHEETVATSSRAGPYLVIKNMAQAQLVAEAIREPTQVDVGAFLQEFHNAHSPGFDPQLHLERVGMAAQTTMIAGEFIAISEVIHQAMLDRYAEELVGEHFLELDTICNATEERQDAIQLLLPYVNLMLVVGGHNSSNTSNLARLAAQRVPAFHVSGPGKLDAQSIFHQPPGQKGEVRTSPWLPVLPHVRIGMTSGASTPDTELEMVLSEVLNLGGGLAGMVDL